MGAFVAWFCPHCGGHINEHELETDELEPIKHESSMGSTYTCGWCGTRTRDWGHVLNCRQEHTDPTLRQMRHSERARDLSALLHEVETHDRWVVDCEMCPWRYTLDANDGEISRQKAITLGQAHTYEMHGDDEYAFRVRKYVKPSKIQADVARR